MNLYLDQMFRVELAQKLWAEGHDVLRAKELDQATADDAEILLKVIEIQRILITLDEHFGNWAVLPLSKQPGVIWLKIHPATTTEAVKLLVPFLAKHHPDEFQNHLVILSRSTERWINTAIIK
jgi:predicted nuclease of predicted toxin-antitoxin system